MQRISDFVQQVTQGIRPFAEGLGAPGLALVAFFDSSFLSLPEVADALVVLAVLNSPSAWPLYAATSTAGSIAGCFTLYAIARKGGESFLRKRFREEHIERGLNLFRRYGLLAVIVPAILPPPAPFKIFVLLAGVANVPTPTFLLAVTLGRGFRYGTEAWLAYRYGPQATAFVRENLPAISIGVAIAIGLIGAAIVVWRRRAAARERLG